MVVLLRQSLRVARVLTAVLPGWAVTLNAFPRTRQLAKTKQTSRLSLFLSLWETICTETLFIYMMVEQEEVQCGDWNFLGALAWEQNDVGKQVVILVKYFFPLGYFFSVLGESSYSYKRPHQLAKTVNSAVVRVFVWDGTHRPSSVLPWSKVFGPQKPSWEAFLCELLLNQPTKKPPAVRVANWCASKTENTIQSNLNTHSLVFIFISKCVMCDTTDRLNLHVRNVLLMLGF